MKTQRCPACGLLIVLTPEELTGAWITCDCGQRFTTQNECGLPAVRRPIQYSPSEPEPIVEPATTCYDDDLIEAAPGRSVLPLLAIFLGLLVFVSLGLAVATLANRDDPAPSAERADRSPRSQAQPDDGRPPEPHRLSPRKLATRDDRDRKQSEQPKGDTGREDNERSNPPAPIKPTAPEDVTEFSDPVKVAVPLEHELVVVDGTKYLWLKEVDAASLVQGQFVRIHGKFHYTGTKTYSRPNGPDWNFLVYTADGPARFEVTSEAPQRQPDVATGPSRTGPGVDRPAPHNPYTSRPEPSESPADVPAFGLMDAVELLAQYGEEQLMQGHKTVGQAILKEAKKRCEAIIRHYAGTSLAERAEVKRIELAALLTEEQDSRDCARRLKVIENLVTQANNAASLHRPEAAELFLAAAVKEYRKLANKYPDSEEAARAKALLNLP